MDQLRELFRKVLAQRVAELERAQKQLRTDPEGARIAIRLVAHALRGSGGTYGFPEVSEAAAAVIAADPAQLPAVLEQLRRVIDKASGAPEPRTVSILVVDDDPAITELLAIVLAAPDRRVSVAHAAAGAEEAIANTDFDLVVLDYYLPDTDGPELLARLREGIELPAVPIVVLSGDTDLQIRRACYELGADEFVTKPFDPQDLAAKVTAHLAKRGGGRLAVASAPGDDLLDLAEFGRTFEKERDAALRDGGPMVLALIRPDDPAIPGRAAEGGGRAALLAQLGGVIASQLRKSDHVARWRNDQFVVLLPSTNLSEAATALEKVRRACRGLSVPSVTGSAVPLTVSIGMTDDIIVPSPEEGILRALPPLHLARAKGGDCTYAVVIPELAAGERDILLAEDDDIVAAILEHRLARAGFRVRRHTSGAAAYADARSQPFAMAILDIKLPEMDGFELLQKLRELPDATATPVIMLTAMGSEKDILRGFKLGADDYVIKPFSPTVLLGRIHQLLRNSARKRIKIRRANTEDRMMQSLETANRPETLNVGS